MSNASTWVHLDFHSSSDETIKFVVELLLKEQSLTISDLKIYANGNLTEWWPLNVISMDSGSTI